MIKIGITGQAGFVGTHLYNELGLQMILYVFLFRIRSLVKNSG